ncbi:MFS transporter [Labrys sp. KB_33_2]|uniref:MFS transporter n=1 Tax=Labrys sp. KB_33_2 TaxID=3237479 RepID=UPI003F91CFDA
MVLAAGLGVIVAQGPVIVFTFGVFVDPVARTLGFERSTLSSALLVLTSAAALATPVIGWLMDRYGIRPVMIPLIALFAASTAALSLMQSSLAMLYGLFILQGIFSASQNPTGYVKAIAARFDRERGLAMGIAMAGAGLGVALVPLYASLLIEAYGWRAAYLGLGLLIVVLALLPVCLFLHEARVLHEARALDRRAVTEARPGGLTLAQVMKRSPQFWLLAAALLLAVTSINGVLAQLVLLLRERGFAPAAAATAMSVAGGAMILGRLIVGYCLDRFFGPHVGMIFFALPVLGIGVLLAGGNSGFLPYVAAALCGLGIGAEIDLMGFLVSRYFGLRAMAAIYAVLFALFTVGSGLGPHIMSLSCDLRQSYDPALIGFAAALSLAIALLSLLGPYRFPAEREGGAGQ